VTRAGLAPLLVALPLVAGCGHGPSGPRLGAGAPTTETRDELLIATGDAVWRGDLATANATLTRLADREHGMTDSALDFWSELLALLRCEPLLRVPKAGRADLELTDPWDDLRRLAQIERVRLSREALPASNATDGGHLKTGLGAQQMVWPVEHELWSDELPMPAIVSRCVGEQAAHAAAPVGADVAPAATAAASAPEVDLVSAAAGQLPAAHPATPLLLVQSAVLEIARGDARAATAPLARLARLAPSGLTPGEHDRVVLADALAAIANPATKPDELLAKGRVALALKISPPARRALSLLLSQRLAAAGKTDDASAVLGPPPHGDDAVGRYIAFKQMEAHARGNRLALLLAEAREVLGRRSHEQVEADPTSQAIMEIALRTLLASPVSDATLEVLESLGPPRERLGRAEAFAQAALEAGAFRSAMATFIWLYENDRDPNRQLQNLARASVAAARAGDRAEFARTFRLLAGQDDSVADTDSPKKGDKNGRKGDKNDKKGGRDDKKSDRDEVMVLGGDRDRNDPRDRDDRRDRATKAADRPDRKPRDGALIASAETEHVREKRRAARSVNWQRALLVVARDALPALVDNDDQANLATLVDTLKRHLGDAGRGPVDEELTTLYRAASAHLKTGARAYAETVGAERRPILLGDVLIGRKYNVPAPAVDLSSAIDEIGTMVFVPRRGNDASTASIVRWPGRLGVAWTGGRS
jgi:hypothetical protein